MTNKQFNEKAINDAYKNAHLALQSISDIMPAVSDDNLRAELKEEYEGYERVIGNISSFMAEKKLTPKDVNPLKKATMWSAIKMKTMMDNSKNQLSEMLIKGTVNGITELTAMKNESSNLDEGVKDLITELLVLEENYESRLKKFL